MKLTGLSIDCLETILEYLEFGDLLNAATSNKQLNRAANFSFHQKNRKKKSLNFKNVELSRDRSFEITSQYTISISDLRTSLQFLRCFGHFVYSIDLARFDSSTQSQLKPDEHILNYINEYCSNSLTHIKVYDLSTHQENWGHHIRKPFPNVSFVQLMGARATDKDINRLFPNMIRLSCSFSSNRSSFITVGHFPNLKSLFSCDYGFGSSALCGDKVTEILSLNPQLEEIYISGRKNFDSKKFHNAIKSLKNLSKLLLQGNLSFDTPTNSFDGIVCLENVTHFFHTEIDRNFTERIPFLFAQLIKLEMSFSGQLNVAFFDFIEKHPKIEHLVLKVEALSEMDVSIIAKTLPMLKEFAFYGYEISVGEAIQFLEMFSNLITFFFKIKDVDAYEEFQASLSNEWESSFFKHGYINVDRRAPKAKKPKLCETVGS